MAAITIRHGLTVSPNSSEEIDSTHATPATKISAFSPAEVRESLKINGTGIKRSKIPPAFILATPQLGYGQKGQGHNDLLASSSDPFISAPKSAATTRSSTEISKLSPTASTFTPRSHVLSGTSPSSITDSGSLTPLDSLAPANGCGISNCLQPGFLSKYGDGPVYTVPNDDCVEHHGPSVKEFPVTVTENGGFRFSSGSHRSFSTNDGTSRTIMVSRIPVNTTLEELQGLFNSFSFKSLRATYLDELSVTGCVYVRFGDMRDADEALMRVERRFSQWTPRYIATSTFTEMTEPMLMDRTPVSAYEAQVLVTATFLPNAETIEVKCLGRLILNLLHRYGDVMILELVSVIDSITVFRAEYYSVQAADSALANGGAIECGIFTLNTQLYQPDLDELCRNPLERLSSPVMSRATIGLERALQNMSVSDNVNDPRCNGFYSETDTTFSALSPRSASFTSRKGLVGKHTPSPLSSNFGIKMLSAGSQAHSPCWNSPCAGSPSFSPQSSMLSPSFSPGAIGQERDTPILFGSQHQSSHHPAKLGYRTRSRQFSDHSQNFTNFVDVNRIRDGIDVRTTIMLRNIPNKINQAELKSIVDETSLGKYDFMYLRIDFANNCNVGYAFINFEDPVNIIEFVNARAGKRWNRFNSDKVAEVSYATIQGRDCLIAKFRNSSVMLEHHSFRPKIFFTGMGARAGTEDIFPPPDNHSKMRRSIENAEHVGLFAPRAGQNFREEQRRRRSHYDRGTSLAEMEESLEGNRRYQNLGTVLPRSQLLRCGPSQM